MPKWIEMELGDFIELKRGYDLPQKDRTAGSIPIVSSSGKSGLHREFKVKGPGVITGRYGTIGEVFYCEEDFWPLNTTLYVKDFKGNDPLFTYYFLKTIRFSDYSDKAAVPGINRNHLHKAIIKVPSDPVYQKELASKLWDLDKKIQLNTQTNQTLESIAQAIFKSWFVDFQPVKAKMAILTEGGTREQAELAAIGAISGKSEAELAQLQQQNREHYQQLSETAALFPSEMVDSELGEIPEGWEVCKFQKIAYVIMGQSPAGDTYNSEANGITLINGPVEFGTYYPEKTKWTTSPTKLAAKDDLIVCVRGSTTGRFIKSDGQYCLGRGVCAIRAKKHQSFIDLFFKHNIGSLLQLATGSTFPNWSSHTLNSFLVIQPIDQILIIFEKHIKSLTAKIESGVVENRHLAEIRNSLLPKLLSGATNVNNMEK